MPTENEFPKEIRAAMVVAHPDDETLWAGGTLLCHPGWSTFILTLCRASDPDRAPKFRRALARYGAAGSMCDLDDGPGQEPLDMASVEVAILGGLPGGPFDVVITHGPAGEYTRHRRHDEASAAVTALWKAGKILAGELWHFAYTDDGGRSLPHSKPAADVRFVLPPEILQAKREIITSLYGFGPESWEAKAIPAEEAFTRLRGLTGAVARKPERG